MTESDPIADAMRQRTEAKKAIACATHHLDRLQKAFDELSMGLAQGLRGVDDSLFAGLDESSTCIPLASGRLDWDDLREVHRLVVSCRQAKKDLAVAEERLRDLGTPI